MRASWCSSLIVAAACAAAPASAQAPNYRVTYRLGVVERAGASTQLLATAVVSGPPETDLRLSLGAGTVEVWALLGTLPEPDTVNLAGVFYTRRQAGRSRRGLPLWEEDSYRRWTRVAWGGTVRLYPFGPAAAGAGPRGALWVEITLEHEFAAGETRASEEVTVIDSTIGFTAQAVIPPRRVTVRMTLVRGDTASSPRTLDLVPEAAGHPVTFALGGETSQFDVNLERPEPPRTGRDSALAVDADVVCLRVLLRASADATRVRCGRLDNVARRVALAGGDTLVATFAWPGVR